MVNHKSRNKSLPLKLKTSAGDTVVEDPQIINDEFNNFFVSIGKEMASSIQTCRSHVSSKISSEEPLKASNSIFLAPSTEMEVYGLIILIKSHKARRAIDTEFRFIKLANPVIAYFLSEMFNLSLTTGIYPDAMNVAEVIPIFKKGDRDKSTNYRSISLLSQFNKIFKKMLHSRIYSFVTKFNLLSEKQFGFRTNFSTNLAACSVYDEIVNELDQNLYNCGIFLDLSKAFDTVNHNILVNKLENHFGFRGRTLELMKSYLTNRFQYTKIGNSKSKLLPIECGVPQGSSLGPLLFTLYINDLPLASKFSATLYADDTYLALSDKNLTQLETRVNDQLQFINAWLQSNKLSLNYTKTTYMLFSKHPHQAVGLNFKVMLNQQEIKRSQSVTYLGLCFDEKLIWTEHINKLSLQLAKHGAMLYQIRDFVNQHTLSMLYYAFVCSRVQYGISVWGTATKTKLREIEIRLNNIVRTITWSKRFTHVTHLYKKLELLKLQDFYKLEIAKIVHKLFNNKLPPILKSRFVKTAMIHAQETRSVKQSNYFFTAC